MSGVYFFPCRRFSRLIGLRFFMGERYLSLYCDPKEEVCSGIDHCCCDFIVSIHNTMKSQQHGLGESAQNCLVFFDFIVSSHSVQLDHKGVRAHYQ